MFQFTKFDIEDFIDSQSTQCLSCPLTIGTWYTTGLVDV
jgi:hypothetical protein